MPVTGLWQQESTTKSAVNRSLEYRIKSLELMIFIEEKFKLHVESFLRPTLYRENLCKNSW